MYSSSMCVHSWCSFHGTFKYCYFFEQVFSTKMTIKLAIFFEFIDKKINANWSLQPALHFAIFFTEIGAVVQKLWYLNETRHILSKYSLAYALKTGTTAI